MLQSWVKIKHYPVMYFDCVTVFKALHITQDFFVGRPHTVKGYGLVCMLAVSIDTQFIVEKN